LIFLLLACFFAGLVDSVVGGGGLIQLPALMIFSPGLSVSYWLGTNKFASGVGTSLAVFRYRHHLQGVWRRVLSYGLIAFFGALGGSYCVSIIPQNIIKPLVLIILIGVTLYTFLKKDFGSVDRTNYLSKRGHLLTLILILSIGFYDGFLGPGTGGFLIFTFVSMLGLNFLRASAAAKVVNLSTNLSSILYFACTSNISYRMAVPMAVANLLGSYAGTFLANRHGVVFVRRFFIAVTAILLLTLSYRWLL
jgi:uncharacterized protein